MSKAQGQFTIIDYNDALTLGTIMSLAVSVLVLLTVGIIIFADRSNQQIVLRTFL